MGKGTVICLSQTFLLKPFASYGDLYFWQDRRELPQFEVKQPGQYTIQITNSCGSSRDSILVKDGLCRLIMPNSFTPNGDGLNDMFRVKFVYATKDFRFSVFNRYGQKIFETTDMNRGWDGTVKSVKQETGAYVWMIKILSRDGVMQTSSGTVILIR